MNKKLRYAPLLLLAPLLMANSPAPFPEYDKYEGVDVTLVSQTQIASGATGDQYEYVVGVKNTGDCYIASPGREDDNVILWIPHANYSTSIYAQPSTPRLFKREVIGPGQSKEVSFTSYEDYSAVEWDKVACTGLVIRDDSVTYEGVDFVRKANTAYSLNFGKIINLGDYYYYAAVDVVYKDENYSFIIDAKKSNDVQTTVALELDRLEIKDITFFRSSYHVYRGGSAASQEIIAIFICVAVASALLISASIVIPVVIIKRKRKTK